NLPPPAPTSTPTATVTPSATRTPTATPSATPSSWPEGVQLSEFLANPKTLYIHEWVELYNSSATAIDLSGWQIDDGAGGGSPYRLPADTMIEAGEYLVIDISPAILNNDGDTVRLLWPDGSEVD